MEAVAAGRSFASGHVRLTRVSALSRAWPEEPDLAASLTSWLEDVVARPDERLGRAGPMCPALPAVLHDDLLLVGRIDRADFTEPKTLDAILARIAAEITGNGNELMCAVLAFPSIETWEIRGCVEFAVERSRAAMVAQGAMIGSFHPYQTRPSRHNRAFQSMRAPTALVGVRRLFPFDRPSLVGDAAALLAFDARWPHSRTYEQETND